MGKTWSTYYKILENSYHKIILEESTFGKLQDAGLQKQPLEAFYKKRCS